MLSVPLTIVAALLVVACVVAPARTDRESTTAVLVGLGLVVVAWGASVGDPTSWPIAAVEVLHEGSTETNVKQLEARSTHAGWLFFEVLAPLTGRGGHATLRTLATGNLLFLALGLALQTAVLRRLLGWVPAAFAGAAVALSPATWHLVWSELPAAAIYLGFWMGVPSAAILAEDPRRVDAWIGLLAASTWMASCRLELVLFPVLAGGTALLRGVVGDDALGAAETRAITALRSRWKRALGAVLLFFGLAIPFLSGPVVGEAMVDLPLSVPGVLGKGAWAIEALSPTFVAGIELPVVLGAHLPAGAALLVGIGFAWSLRRWRATLALGIATLWLYRTYVDASHLAVFEVYRYTLLLWGPGALLVALGAQASSRPLQLLCALGCLIPALPDVGGIPFLPPSQARGRPAILVAIPQPGPAHFPEPFPSWRPVDRNPQREVRLLLQTMGSAPSCLWFTRSADWGDPSRDRLVAFFPPDRCELTHDHTHGDALPTEITLRGLLDGDQSHPKVDWMVRALTTGGPVCVRYWESTDCGLEGVDCTEDVASLNRLDRWTWSDRPYNTAFHGRSRDGRPVTVGVWAGSRGLPIPERPPPTP